MEDNKRLIHTFKYGNKEIPMYYNSEEVKDRLIETTKIVELFLDYLEKKNIVFSDKQKNLIMAEEDICSSYIEGYETYLSPEFVVEGYTSGSLADRATLSGFAAYEYAFKEYFNKGVEIDDSKKIVDVWKRLVKYKRFFRRNIRISGVRVGNALHTVHVAPPAKYVKLLLNDMFKSLEMYENEEEDKYKLLNGILFHYIFTFIHPFLDGNGRSARLIEQLMLMKNSGIPCCVPFSSIILRNKRGYYKSFNSGQTFGESHLDVLTIDITDFINYNLFVIEQGIVFISNELKIDIFENKENLKEEVEKYKDTYNEIERKKIIETVGCEAFVKALLSGVIVYNDEDLNVVQLGDLGIWGNRKRPFLFGDDLSED